MSGVIKSSDIAASASVRSLATARKAVVTRRPEPLTDPELLMLRHDVEALRDELAQREAAIANHEAELHRARDEGEARGREAGGREAEDGAVERTAALRQGMEQALRRYAEEIGSLERLAPLLACASLEKVLGDPANHAALLGQVIRKQIEAIDGQALIRIEVSTADFPGPASLADLAAAAGRPGAEVLTCDDLGPGGCRIKLRLGALDVGIGQQWDRLRQALEGLAEPEASA